MKNKLDELIQKTWFYDICGLQENAIKNIEKYLPDFVKGQLDGNFSIYIKNRKTIILDRLDLK